MKHGGRRLGLLAAAIVVPLALAGGAIIAVSSLSAEPEARASDLYGEPSQEAAAAATSSSTVAQHVDAPAILGSPVERMRIERIDVDADIVVMNLDARGDMATPDDPELIAWYDFTGKPGLGHGNAVFAGHRDWRDYGPAVFWDLEELQHGDVIEVELLDGSRLRYTVTAAHTYPLDELDMREILAPTDEEVLTLITCAGAFEANDYTDRHVVRAVRSEALPAPR